MSTPLATSKSYSTEYLLILIAMTIQYSLSLLESSSAPLYIGIR